VNHRENILTEEVLIGGTMLDDGIASTRIANGPSASLKRINYSGPVGTAAMLSPASPPVRATRVLLDPEDDYPGMQQQDTLDQLQ